MLLSAVAISIYGYQKQELISALEERIRITEQSIIDITKNRKKALITTVKTVSEDWGLRQAIGQNDIKTIASALNNHRIRVNADKALYFSKDGSIIGSNSDMPNELKDIWGKLIKTQTFDKHQTLRIGGEYYHIVLSDIKAPKTIGWLCMTYKFSGLHKTILQVSKHNNLKIAILDTTAKPTIVLASHSLQTEEKAALFASAALKSYADFNNIAIGDDKIVSRLSPLQGSEQFYISVFGSIDETLKTLEKFWQRMAMLFLIFAIVALFITYLVAKGITRPLELLLQTAKKLENGDFSTEIDIRRADEIGDLAVAFRKMQKAISEREKALQESMRKLRHQATHDTLTGLSNRRTLSRELELANQAIIDYEEHFNLCILDLDRFKVVNDTSGHAAGDALLMQVGSLLRGAVYSSDTVVRLGGDEFAILLRDCGSEVALRICNGIRQQIEKLVFHWEGTSHKIGVSIGILSVSEPVSNISEIMQRADAGCFVAKEQGRNQVHLVEDSSSSVDEKRDELHWVQRLNAAIDNDQFVLFVQPIVSLAHSETIERFEVLIRLRNESTGKLIPPGAFIPSAERYGLNTKIDRWVIQKLLEMISNNSILLGENKTYWINLSGNSFSDKSFVKFLEKTVSESSLPAGSLNFEITETAIIRNIMEATEVMRKLKSLGCRFALDDFGAGLSSFSYLKSLPVDYLKIDGAFIRNILNDNIDRMFVKSIVDIAHAMDLKTTAEFVENENILKEVIGLGIDYGQGFELGRPKELLLDAANMEAIKRDKWRDNNQ